MPTATAYGQRPNQPQVADRLKEHDDLKPVRDLMHYLREYAKENPEVAALTCVSIGFILGWKLKMW